MKRRFLLVIVAAMTICLAACGNALSDDSASTSSDASVEEGQSNEITDLLDDGLIITQIAATEESFKALVQTEGGFDQLYVAEAAMTSEKYEEYSQIDMGAEDYAEVMRNFIASLSDTKVTDVTDQLPAEDAFEEYKGLTVGELEDEGYGNTGYYLDDDQWVFFYDGPMFSLELKVDGDANSPDDLTPEKMREFVIQEASFVGLSNMFIDNM